MAFSPKNEPEESLWWDLISDYPELGEGLEAFGKDPETGVVTAVGIFTMLKLRFWQRLPGPVTESSYEEHRSDDSPPPQAGKAAGLN